MRRNFKIMLIALFALLIVTSIGAISFLTPHYKTIELNGYIMEVPDSSINVTSVNDNYKTYDDKNHNITIKSYAINNVNEINYTGAVDLGTQIGSNIGNNTTIETKTVLNQSGKYTYHDFTNYQMITITTDDFEIMSHILKTLNKTEITPNTNDTTLNLMTISNNTTDANNTTTNSNTKKTQTSTKKTTSNSKKTGSNDIYIEGDPEATGEYVGVGEATYRNKKTGKVYVQNGKNNLQRRSDLDHWSGLAG